MFNLSIRTGKVPMKLKCSRITPVLKSGKKTDMNNYRPISILPLCAKILEKIVYNQVHVYLKAADIINVNQSVNQTTLLKVTEDWLSSMDTGKLVGMVTIDLRKAFDTVDHSVLLDKLRSIGMGPLACEWFGDYLSGRFQYTEVNAVRSQPLNVRCGVPQGSNLGPLLFMIYINDLPNCLQHSSVALYADDTCIYFSGERISQIETKLNTDLEYVSKWLKCNHLVLNSNKCEAMIICLHKRVKKQHINTN